MSAWLPAEQVSDRERERVVQLLKAHTVAGHLTTRDFGARMNEAYAARTAGELDGALQGLPRRVHSPVLTRAAARARSLFAIRPGSL